MNKSRQELIAELTSELQPVTRPGRVARQLALWLLASAAVVTVAVLAVGPPRPQLVAQLAHAPQFLLESALGVAAIIALASAAFASGIP